MSVLVSSYHICEYILSLLRCYEGLYRVLVKVSREHYRVYEGKKVKTGEVGGTYG